MTSPTNDGKSKDSEYDVAKIEDRITQMNLVSNFKDDELGIEHFLTLLRVRTRFLRLLGVSVTVLTVLALGSLLLRIAELRIAESTFTFYISQGLVSVSFAICAIMICIIFDIFKKSSDTIYDEVSDELQWMIRSSKSESKSEIVERRPDINVRYILRDYLVATDLPLVPGRYGAASYILFNLAVVAFYATFDF